MTVGRRGNERQPRARAMRALRSIRRHTAAHRAAPPVIQRAHMEAEGPRPFAGNVFTN